MYVYEVVVFVSLSVCLSPLSSLPSLLFCLLFSFDYLCSPLPPPSLSSFPPSPPPRGIDVRAYVQNVQSIRPTTPIKFMASSKSTFIASQSEIYMLEPQAYDGQILSCIEQKQFELALSIAVSPCCPSPL